MHISNSSGRGRKKNLTFELNLVPFIDVLSTCICFLLVTAVFVNLGSLQVSQAVGSAAKQEQKKQGSVTVSLGNQGDLRLEVKDVAGLSASSSTVNISGQSGKINFADLSQWVESFSAKHQDVKTVLLMPNPFSKYDDLVQLMAQFKKVQMDQIGIAPL